MGNLTRMAIGLLILGCASTREPMTHPCPPPHAENPETPARSSGGGIPSWLSDLLPPTPPPEGEPDASEAARIRAAMDRRYGDCAEPHPRGALCGLLFGAGSEERIARICADEGLSGEECDAWMARDLERVFPARYPRANHRAVLLRCAQAAGVCDTPKKREILWFLEHNAGVERELRALGVEP